MTGTCCGFGKAAPAAADLQNVRAGLQPKLVQDTYVFLVLRPRERPLGFAFEQRRRIRHRGIEPKPIEVVAQIVVRYGVLSCAPL